MYYLFNDYMLVKLKSLILYFLLDKKYEASIRQIAILVLFNKKPLSERKKYLTRFDFSIKNSFRKAC